MLPLVLINWIPEEDPEIDHLGGGEQLEHGGYSSIEKLDRLQANV